MNLIKIAMTSDNHLDVNHLDPQVIMEQQINYLRKIGVGYYLIAGDQFNDFRKTQAFVYQMNAKFKHDIQVFYIAGNHDMVNGIDYPALQQSQDPYYLHQKYVDIPSSNWRIIGNNGWYDYRFATNLPNKTPADFNQWRNAFWIDGGIDNRPPDEEIMQRVLNNVYENLEAARQADKKVLFMTHFVPIRDFIFYSADRPYWNMANALMGSQRLGQLLEAYQVQHVVFGHLHVRHPATTFRGVTYHNSPVGYGLKRMHEWQSSDFMTEWRNSLQIVEI